MQARKALTRFVGASAIAMTAAIGLAAGPASASGPDHGGREVSSISTVGNTVTYGYTDGSSSTWNMQTGEITQGDDGSYSNITWEQS